MKEVMMCAQKLAEAILNSDVYQHMHALEEQVTQDEDATKAIAAYMEKRTAVEQAMRKPDIDPTQLAEAAQELEDVQQAMNDCPIIRDMRDAQKKYQDMMDNVNRILAPCRHRRNGRRQRRSAHLRLHRQLRLLRRLPLIRNKQEDYLWKHAFMGWKSSKPAEKLLPRATNMSGGWSPEGAVAQTRHSTDPSGRSLVTFWRAQEVTPSPPQRRREQRKKPMRHIP